MFDKDLIAEIAIGFTASYVFAAFLLVRQRGTEKGFWNWSSPILDAVAEFRILFSVQLNIGLAEPEFRPQTSVFPTADSLSTNSATASFLWSI